MVNRPLIIGHRGASAVAPENTLIAFSRAMSDGADGIEFDVRLTRDGVPVVIHDATLNRVAGMDVPVAELSTNELCKIDVGSWFNQRLPLLARAAYAGETVPTLAQVFSLLEKDKAIFYLEMKDSSDELTRATVSLIRRHGMVHHTVVECFHLPALADVKNLNAEIRTAALFGSSLRHPGALINKMNVVERALECGADELALHYTLASRRLIASATRKKMETVVWTVDNPRWLRRAWAYGIKGLITNNPADLISSRASSP